eukprot:8593225-Prorocentrum_lima.AAC.1
MHAALTAKHSLPFGESATQPSPVAKARGRSARIPRGLDVLPAVVPISQSQALSPTRNPPVSPTAKRP